MDYLWLIPAVIIGGLVVLSVMSQRGSPPGVQLGRLQAGSPKPNAVSSEPDTPEPQRVEPLRGTRANVRAAIAATNGKITSETDDYISATYSTPLLRFVDDVEFRRDASAGYEQWHVRSASRVGHSDMGTNRKRVETIRAALATAFESQP